MTKLALAGLAAAIASAIGGGAASAQGAGMPQLNPAGFMPQLVWLGIVFVALYLLMRFVALPRITQVLEERQSRIAHDLDDAEQLKREADKAKADYEAQIAAGRAKAQALAIESRQHVNAQVARQRASQDAAAAEASKAADAAIAAATVKAMANADSVAADLARALAQRLAGIDLDPATVRAAVERASAERAALTRAVAGRA